MASGTGIAPISLHRTVDNQAPPQHGGASVSVQSGDANIFPEEGKIRELAQQIHSCLYQAEQLKLANAQHQPSASQQVSVCR